MILGLVVTSSCSLMSSGWADKVSAQLTCGMTYSDIQRVAGRPVIIREDGGWLGQGYLKKGSNGIDLFVGADDRLLAVRRYRLRGFKSYEHSPRHYLCTGLKTVDLSIRAPEGFEGADIYLDGVKLGEISKWLVTRIEVPLGIHELSLEKAGYVTISKTLIYDLTSTGPYSLPLQGKAKRLPE